MMTLRPAPPGELINLLTALDEVLAAAVARMDAQLGADAADGFRGLHLSAADVARELARTPGTPQHGTPLDTFVAKLSSHRRLRSLIATYQLDRFEAACVVLAMAPEIDLRYERIYAYLQDDITRKRPTATLALSLFCADAAERDECHSALAPGARLFASHVLDDVPVETSRLAAPLVVNDQILRYLLGEPGLDPRLASWCTLIAAENRPLPPGIDPPGVEALARLATRAASSGRAFIAHLQGAHGTGKLQTAHVLATRLGRSLVVANLRAAVQSGDFAGGLRQMLRATTLQHAVAFLHGYDSLVEGNDRQLLRSLTAALAASQAIVVVASTHEWHGVAGVCLPVAHVAINGDAPAARKAAWSAALEGIGVTLPDESIASLAERFRLTAGPIAAAVAAASTQCQWEHACGMRSDEKPAATDLARAARAHSGRALAALAQRVQPRRTWNDLVLANEGLGVLREICARVAHRSRVFTEWGFEAQLSTGCGVTALFAGPSGTGKTLAAEVVAGALELDLFRVDLANVVSKYIGETEKNLDRVFDAAHDANAVLLFDEADAIFGKRTEVRDAHDRYANLEISYLLQKMEGFDGLAILSTNMRQNIDEAFTRRLTFTVHFPFPEEADRRRIWEIIWPDRLPRAADVDAATLGRDLTLSGGHIRNAALGAAFYAAADGGVVTHAHVMRAVRREFQKMGKVMGA